MIKFRSSGKEFEDIKSGKVKKIIRKIDRYNPVFKKIEEMNERYAHGYPYSMVDIYEDGGYESFRIKKISYLDGNVIIEW